MPSGSGSAPRTSAAADPPRGGAPPGLMPARRWLAAIRFDEVLVLQAPPLLGLAIGAARGALPQPATLLVFLAASCTLIAHVFVLNDWSDLAAGRTVRRSLGPRQALTLSIALLAGALGLFALLGPRPFLLALGIALLSALYSAPFLHVKGIPVASSLLHLAGGILHFLLGHAVAAKPDTGSLVIACGITLTFAGGHLTQEVRDHDDDLAHGTRTNAVVFGKRAAFAAGFVLFTLGFGALLVLAVQQVGSTALGLVVALLACVHAAGAIRLLRSPLASEQVRRFQWRYRALFAVAGVAIVAALVVRGALQEPGPAVSTPGAGPPAAAAGRS